MEAKKFSLQAPWREYAVKMEMLFAKDPEVGVEYDDDGKKIILHVDSQEKADALARLIGGEVEFGNVKVTVEIVPSNQAEKTQFELFRTAFKGNPVVSYVKKVQSMGFEAGYVVFEPEVVQYFNDDLGDINGFKSTLYEDIAEYIFDQHEGVFFCTDLID